MIGMLLDPAALDIAFADGGPVFGNTDEQNVALNIIGMKGDCKDYPYIGANAYDSINDDDTNGANLISRIRVSLTKDGATVKTLNYVNGQFQIDASYGN